MAIVGAGILGLAHAYFAAKRGRSVVVFERTARAQGASVRNFGMIWPIGQRAGIVHQTAMRSRQIWQEFLDAARLPYRPTGSLHVVYHQDEAEVAREFVERAPGLAYICTWLSRDDALATSNAINPAGLLGAIWSPTEITVDPRLILARLPEFLSEKFAVQFRFGTAVRSI
ncbi:MAG TPA: FAD-dependent oxidoreductase, partial [Candidatus Binatus sp.]|nr:FAD-dependent oxidoreductase [Candidatus Binatus sp.]